MPCGSTARLLIPSWRPLTVRAARTIVLGVFAVFFVLPLVWLVLAPTKTDSDLLYRDPLAVGSLHNLAAAWRNLNRFDDHVYLRWLANSLTYSLTATGLSLIAGIPAGYGLALRKFRGRNLILGLTLVSMLMPASTLVLPIFLELNGLGLIGSPFSIILPFAFFPFGVYLAYIYFANALPASLLDAARIDGCDELQAFLRVALPLAKPVLALIFFFSFVADWNNFFLPYAILADERQLPVQVGLSDIFQSTRPTVALAAVIAALPIAIVFIASQRALLRGIVDGGAKG